MPASLKPRQVEKVLLSNGFVIKRQTGSHRIYFKLKKSDLVIVPFHSKDIPRGTLRSIIKKSGLEEEEFVKR